jgi:dephospho-CoA kinase
LVIGLTGGIACGKSSISSLLKREGFLIIDADEIAREIVKPYSRVWEEIVENWGSDVLLPDNFLNRTRLGSIVFNNKDELKKLNDITHPEIIREIKQRIVNAGTAHICIDAALLIETGLHSIVDTVWLVILDRDVQVARLMERDSLSPEDAICRIQLQMSLEEKKKYADLIIDNNGLWKDTEYFLLSCLSRLIKGGK